MIGVGADDLRGRAGPALARWLVRHVDLLVLRDEESAAVLAGAGAPAPFWIGADPAWMLAGGWRDRRVVAADGRRRSPSPSATSPATRVCSPTWPPRCAPLLGDHSVQLQPWQVGADGRDRGSPTAPRAARQRRQGPRPAGQPRPRPPSVAGDDLVIGLRFHALVAAGMAGTRFVAIAHEPKLAGLARRLGQVSVPATPPPTVLDGAIDHALDHDPAAPTPSPARSPAPSARSTCCGSCSSTACREPGGSPASAVRRGAGAW